MRHGRHDSALHPIEETAKRAIGGDHYLIIVWDGPQFIGLRAASFVSDSPVGDVKLICKAVAEQIKDD